MLYLATAKDMSKAALDNYPYQDTTTVLLPEEAWRDVPGYEGYYQVSSRGRVRSVDRVIPHPRLGRQTVRGRLLTQKVTEPP